MAAETAVQFAALEAQAQTLMSVFTKAGHEAVAPAIIQPADVFLDCVGEALRARTYVFTDPDGAELCLRPDLTLPTCRLHIARHSDAAKPARYCYNGPAFRFQPQGADAVHPREFRQAGVERFGDRERETAEAETIALIIRAIESVGLREWSLTLGDLGLFRSVLAAAEMPERWRKRLSNVFWRPEAFRAELRLLSETPDAAVRKLPPEILAAVKHSDAEARVAAVGGYLERSGIELVGMRTLPEIVEHLCDVAADAGAAPLAGSAHRLIESYTGITGPAHNVAERISALLKGAKGGTGAALDAFDRRLAQLANAGIDIARVTFSAEFGRSLEYYTGLVFEVTAPGFGAGSAIAGGGRYDNLLRSAGAGTEVPAVGGAIHTERLLQAVKGGV